MLTARVVRVLSLVVVLGASAPSWSACSGSSEASAATSSAARAAVERGALLLDVRSPGEFASGHLAGAVNLPIDQLGARLGEIAPGRPVVVYCRSGRRSAAAARILSERGHEVIDVGPMESW